MRRRGEKNGSISLKGDIKCLSNHPRPTRWKPPEKKDSKEKVSAYEILQIGTALNIGESPLPAGVALKIAN